MLNFTVKWEFLDISCHEMTCDIYNWTSHCYSGTYTIDSCLCFAWTPSLRFGDGYTIILRLWDSKSSPDSCSVSAYMKSSFPSIELKERHENVLQYQLPSHACCLARVFDVLANNYEELGIADFSVSQTTLDQVRMMMMMTDVGCTPVSKGLLYWCKMQQCPLGKVQMWFN